MFQQISDTDSKFLRPRGQLHLQLASDLEDTSQLLHESPLPSLSNSRASPIPVLIKDSPTAKLIKPAEKSVPTDWQKSNCSQFLQDHFKISQRRAGVEVSNLIADTLRKQEAVVYSSESGQEPSDYLNFMYSQSASPNEQLRKELASSMTGAAERVGQDIGRKYTINQQSLPKTKDDLQELERKDKYRLVRLRAGQVRNNLSGLREQIEQELVRERVKQKALLEEGITDNYFSIDHPKTKQASSFIREVRHKRKSEHDSYNEMLRSQKQQEAQQQQEKQLQSQLALEERRNKLREVYENKLQERLEQKEVERQKKEEYKEWIRMYKREKPLELEKEEEYRMKVLIPELEEQQKKLQTIKAERRPIDPDELFQHEHKYTEFRKDDRIRKLAEMSMRHEEETMNKEELDDRLYKGKYRYLVLETMLEEKNIVPAREIELSKLQRKIAYAEQIRLYEKDRTQRRQQPGTTIEAETLSKQKFVRRVRNMDGSLTVQAGVDRDVQSSSLKEVQSERASRKDSQELPSNHAYLEGIKNLHLVKNMVRDQRVKEEQNPPQIRLVEQNQVERPKNNLQIYREQRLQKLANKKGRQKWGDDEDESKGVPNVNTNEQIDLLKLRSEKHDDHIRREAVKIKHNETDGQQMEGHLLEAIKVKMQMLNSLD